MRQPEISAQQLSMYWTGMPQPLAVMLNLLIAKASKPPRLYLRAPRTAESAAPSDFEACETSLPGG